MPNNSWKSSIVDDVYAAVKAKILVTLFRNWVAYFVQSVSLNELTDLTETAKPAFLHKNEIYEKTGSTQKFGVVSDNSAVGTSFRERVAILSEMTFF